MEDVISRHLVLDRFFGPIGLRHSRRMCLTRSSDHVASKNPAWTRISLFMSSLSSVFVRWQAPSSAPFL